jgi:hypothetical protein
VRRLAYLPSPRPRPIPTVRGHLSWRADALGSGRTIEGVTTYGARGTDDLSPEQVPRSRKLTRRAQPYRKRRRDRQLGPTLEAMLGGGPKFLNNPTDFRRAREKGFWRMYRNGR